MTRRSHRRTQCARAKFSRSLTRDAYRRSLVTGIENSVGGNVIKSLAYSYDALNRPISCNADTFGYNERGEVIVSRRAAENAEEAYSYDDIGNLLVSSLNTATNTYASNNRNQYTSIFCASASLRETSYDLDGNMTQHGEWTYIYDSGNRLVSVASNEITVATMSYDSQGRRVKKVAADGTHRYFYDGWLLVYEHVVRPNNATNEIEYAWGKDVSGTRDGAAGIGGLLYLKRDGAIYVPWYDAHGNILGYCDAQGNIVASYTYDAFGNIVSQSGTMPDAFAFRFSTKYFDSECCLYYYGYRYYKPQIMRWLTEDPLDISGGVNLYAMCENDTISYCDVLGEARMITGSLFALKGTNRIVFSGYNHARNIIRLVDKLNNLSIGGKKLYDARICDLVTTPIASLKKEISENVNNVYIIAHGGLIVNNKVFRGRHYTWNESDNVEERIFPTGKAPGIDVHSLGANMNNVFGCYISSAVRKVPSRTLWRTQYTSSVDDYGRMFEALYNRLARYATNPQPQKCPIRIRIFEGENANEANKPYAETENALRLRPIRDEEEYK